MSDFNNLLTDAEIKRIVSNYLKTENAELDKVSDILDLLAFYGECKLVFDGIVSGDLEITGVGSGGIEYCLSEKARQRLH